MLFFIKYWEEGSKLSISFLKPLYGINYENVINHIVFIITIVIVRCKDKRIIMLINEIFIIEPSPFHNRN